MEYENVLIPCDFSEYSEAAVQRVVEIYGVKKVMLLHVVTPHESSHDGHPSGKEDDMKKTVEQKLETYKQFLGQQNIPATILIEPLRHNAISQTVLDVARKTNASLIVIGAHGKGGIREFFLGSVSHEVIRNARQHVLLIHTNKGAFNHKEENQISCPLLFSSILCPVDLSKPSEETVRSLQQFPKRSKVILLHVIRTAESLKHLGLLRRRATIKLSALKEQLESHGINTDVIIRSGDPVMVSCTEAERKDVSLIMLSRFCKLDYTKNIPIGSTADAIALRSTRPVLIRIPQLVLDVLVRELSPDEFTLAEQVWIHYHQQKADRATDRIFGIFVERTIAGIARCRRHPDGSEVDGVYVLNEFRDRGYARRLMQFLVGRCGTDVLYMHSTLELVSFYRTFGFEPIPEDNLPPTIRERFNFALGNMQGSDICPMRRVPPQQSSQ